VRDLELSEVEVFITLSEELHFGHTARRLYLSQGRVSQLLRSLERRVGAALFTRSSRQVALTPLGRTFLAEARPAYSNLTGALTRARATARGTKTRLRLGFVGIAQPRLIEAVAAFRGGHPDIEIELSQLKLADPFTAVQRGELDAAFACLPVVEAGLVAGPVLSRVPVVLTVAADHPFASRESVTAEDLAEVRMVELAAQVPPDWRESMSPTRTPSGRPITRGPVASTHQEALSLIATGQGALVFCELIKAYSTRRDLAHIPIVDLPESAYALVWRRDGETWPLRAFIEVAEGFAMDPGPAIAGRVRFLNVAG
jgi:DNA-binding transcriptional LysR family regulator